MKELLSYHRNCFCCPFVFVVGELNNSPFLPPMLFPMFLWSHIQTGLNIPTQSGIFHFYFALWFFFFLTKPLLVLVSGNQVSDFFLRGELCCFTGERQFAKIFAHCSLVVGSSTVHASMNIHAHVAWCLRSFSTVRLPNERHEGLISIHTEEMPGYLVGQQWARVSPSSHIFNKMHGVTALMLGQFREEWY